MNLARTLEPLFDEVTVEHGYDYYEEGRVTLLKVANERTTAWVRGMKRYNVEIELVSGSVGTHCNCPAFSQWGPCKHVYATLLALDAVRQESTPNWQRRIERVERPDARDPWSGVADAAVRVFAVVDVASSVQGNGITVLLRYRRRLKSGAWSVLKAYRPGRGSAPAIPSAARELVQHLASADPMGVYSDSCSDELHLRHKHTGLVLRQAAAAGLLHWTYDVRDEIEPVTLDDGPPWEFVLAVSRDKTSATLTAHLERDGERMQLDEPELVLEDGLLLTQGRLAGLDLHGAMPWVRELRARGEIVAPLEDAPELVRAIVEGAGDPELRIEGIETAVAPEPSPRLDIDFAGEARDVPCTISFLYGKAEVVADEACARLADPESGTVFRRRLADEQRLLQRFLELGGSAGDVPRVSRRDAARIALALMDDGWMVTSRGVPWRLAGDLEFSVSSGIDWFELEGGLRFGDEHVALPAILRSLRAGDSHVRLADGSLGVLPADAADRLRALRSLGCEDGEGLRFARSQGWLLDCLLAERGQVARDGEFAELCRRLSAFDGIAPQTEGAGFSGKLRSYQREALGWFDFLREMGLGGCLADDMGLGKTVMVLAMLLARRQGPALVVAPRSVVWNWIQETGRFAPDLRVMDYTGLKRRKRFDAISEADLVVTTYGILRHDAPRLKDIEFDYVILDEAQAIKNPKSHAWKAARLLSARHRLALTGTPVQNHLGDLWSLMEFLNPGMLGPASRFKAWSSGNGRTEQDHERIARAMRPVLLRRTKEQVLKDLPGRTESTIVCEMGAKQAEAYGELAAHYRGVLLGEVDRRGLGRVKMQILEALLRLRQVACHPGLVDKERSGQPSAKLDALMPMLDEIRESGHKALVFSQFTSFLALLRERLDSDGIAYCYLDGSTRKLRLSARSVVESRRGAAGGRPRAQNRPETRRDRVPAGVSRHGRGAHPRVAGSQA